MRFSPHFPSLPQLPDGKTISRLAVAKLFLALYLPMALVLTGLVYGTLRIDAEIGLQALRAQEAGEVKLAGQILTHDFEEVAADLRLLSRTPALKHFLDTGSPEEKQRLTAQFLDMSQEKRHYDQIRYLDSSGMETIRVNLVDGKAEAVPEKELQNKAGRYFFSDSLRLGQGEVYISPLDLNIEQGRIEIPHKPMLRFGTPAFDSAGEKKGVVLINYYGSELIGDFRRAMAEKRHAMLLNRDGYWLSSPDPSLEWGFMFGRETTFTGQYPEAWARIKAADEGVLMTGQGLLTHATVYPLLAGLRSATGTPSAEGASAHELSAREYYWKVVSLVPASELPSPSLTRHPGILALYSTGMALLALLAGFMAVTMPTRRQFRRTLAENEARLREITATLAEAVYVIDTHGRIVFANPETERLLGWPEAELIGQHAHSKLHYRKADGTPNPACDCPIYRALGTGQTYRGDSEVFWRKDGTPVPVGVSASPIVRDGKMAGAVVAFSDISERKQIQERLLRNQAQLTEAQRLAHLGSWELDLASDVLVWSEEIYRIFEIDPSAFGASYDAFLNAIHPEDRARVHYTYSESVASHAPYSTEHRLLFPDGRIKYVMELGETFYDAEGRPLRSVGTVQEITERVQLQAVDTLLHAIDQHALRSESLPELLQFVCEETARMLDYRFAWIGRKEADGLVSISASAGPEAGYRAELERASVRWDDTPQGRGPTGTAIRTGQMQVFKLSDSGFQPWHDAARRYGPESAAALPLVIRGEVYGAFTLYSRHAHSFDDPAAKQRLSGIASRICVALEMAMDQMQLRLIGTALASAGNGVFITDRRGRIQWINAAFTRLTGYAAEDALDFTPGILKSGKQDGAYYQALWTTILRGETWSSEAVERHKNGTLFTVQQTITPIRDEQGEISHFISILEDITAQKETAARIQHMAHYDALTDLPNRTLFYDRLQQALAQAKRGEYLCALMFLDLDRFKMVNDSLGHHIGDLLLQGVAQRISACVRETDTVSRLAGDEFVVILPHQTAREDAAAIAQKIVATLAEPFLLEGHEVITSASIGIALYPLDAAKHEELLKLADLAMYAAKHQGRGQYLFYTDVSARNADASGPGQ